MGIRIYAAMVRSSSDPRTLNVFNWYIVYQVQISPFREDVIFNFYQFNTCDLLFNIIKTVIHSRSRKGV